MQCAAQKLRSPNCVLCFHDIAISSIPQISDALLNQTSRTCDYTPGVVYMWRKYLQTKIAWYGDTLIMRNTTLDGSLTFSLPMGPDTDGALDAISRYACAKGIPLLFDMMTAEQAQIVCEHFHTEFCEPATKRDWADYLYNIDDLVYLKGKKFSGQRNHINKFNKVYPDYTFKLIEPSDLPRIKGFMEAYTASLENAPPLALCENAMIWDVLANYESIEAIGGYVEIDGEIAAYAIGEVVGDTLYVHIEKANRAYPGSYTMINRDFAAAVYELHPEIKYVNREEDLGDMGLRTAKLSYHPAALLEKYLVRVHL